MQPDDYAPFPETMLLKLAEGYDDMADRMLRYKPVGVLLETGEGFRLRAVQLRDAVKCHEALRERCLLAEQRVRLLDPDVLASDAP